MSVQSFYNKWPNRSSSWTGAVALCEEMEQIEYAYVGITHMRRQQ